jgi:hypothetical protein
LATTQFLLVLNRPRKRVAQLFLDEFLGAISCPQRGYFYPQSGVVVHASSTWFSTAVGRPRRVPCTILLRDWVPESVRRNKIHASATPAYHL